MVISIWCSLNVNKGFSFEMKERPMCIAVYWCFIIAVICYSANDWWSLTFAIIRCVSVETIIQLTEYTSKITLVGYLQMEQYNSLRN